MRIPFYKFQFQRSGSGAPGFTLVEVLLSLVLAAAIAGVTVQALRQVLSFSARMTHATLAQERGQTVLSILESRVLHAGFGLTWERVGTVFQRSFGGDAAGYPPPSRWDGRGPLQVLRSDFSPAPEADGVCRGPALAVLYAVPSGLAAKLDGNEPVSMDAGHSVKVRLLPPENLSRAADRLAITDRADLRSWVVFPLMEYPVHASSYLAGELTVSMAENTGLPPSILRPYDEMHHLRADRFHIPLNSQSLVSEELHAHWSGMEYRADGILAMWFEWTRSDRPPHDELLYDRLDAWILTTGGTAASKTARPSDWPAGALWLDEFSRHDVAVVRGSWLIQNL